MKLLAVSLVAYRSDKAQLQAVLDSFEKVTVPYDFFVIDQSPTDELRAFFSDKNVIYEYTGTNLGYGGGHNVGIAKAIAGGYPYHLVTNPDLYFPEHTIEPMLAHMERNPNMGLTCPKIFWPDGELQPTCRRDPKPFDLFARRFLPAKWMQKRLDRYSMQDKNYNDEIDVEFSPGSFMFFRTEALKKVNGFDDAFFMYMEDADISRRVRKAGYQVRLTPSASVFHERQSGHRTNKKLLIAFFRSVFIYFNKWGWWPFF